ncbi:MAG TPA: hypothetical protein VM536_07645 [Chloroflexia bacterium]|nr:hypothetical protein [Chloroflexia bacterium]
MTSSRDPIGPFVGQEESAPLYCANHPTVPTYLRCGRCEKPICAKCRIHTPIGYRCFDCANVSVLPTYAVSNTFYARAILGGIMVATVVGLLGAMLPGFDFWIMLILGVGVGEVVSAAANQKRGPGLQAVGLASVVWGVVLSRLALAFLLTVRPMAQFMANIPGNGNAPLFDALDTAGRNFDVPSLFLGFFQHTDPVGYLFIALALGLAYFRLR